MANFTLEESYLCNIKKKYNKNGLAENSVSHYELQHQDLRCLKIQLHVFSSLVVKDKYFYLLGDIIRSCNSSDKKKYPVTEVECEILICRLYIHIYIASRI